MYQDWGEEAWGRREGIKKGGINERTYAVTEIKQRQNRVLDQIYVKKTTIQVIYLGTFFFLKKAVWTGSRSSQRQ